MNEKNKIISAKEFNKLIEGISHHSDAAVEKFYYLFGRYIFSVALTLSKSYFISQEVSDDLIIKIWENKSEIKYVRRPFCWLYTVTANCTIDKLKQEKQYTEIYDMPQDDKNIEEFFSRETFLSYIGFLPEEEQQIMMLYFVLKLPFRLIADELGKKLSTVTSKFYRAREKVKEKILKRMQQN